MDAAIKEKAHEVHSISSKKSAPGVIANNGGEKSGAVMQVNANVGGVNTVSKDDNVARMSNHQDFNAINLQKSSNIPDLNQLTIMDTSAQNIPQPAKHMGDLINSLTKPSIGAQEKKNQEDQLLQNGSVKVSRKNKQQIPKKTGAVKESFVLKKKQTGLAVSSKSFKLPSKPQSLSRESKERIFLSLTKGDTNMFLNDIARNVNPSPSSNLALSSISGKQENGQLLERGQQNGKILIPDKEFKETNEPPDALVKSVLGNQAHNNLVDSDEGLEKRAFPPNKRPHKKISYLYLSAFGNPYWWTACKAGGIWILWNSSEVNIQVLHTDHQFIHSKISWLNYHKHEFFTFVYASPRRQERHALWDALENIQPQNNNEWCIMSDFNTYIHSEEKRGSSVHNWRSMQDFQDCLMSCHLSDLGHQGPSFTWRRGNLLERLDRACVNQSWNMSFPNRVISHLPFYNSDHRPILLWDGQPNFSNGGARPFRFLAAWLTHNSFSDLVKRCWAGGHNWKASSENFREKATSWHKDCYKEEEKLKNNLHSRLRGIDYSLSQHPCHSLERLQKEIWQQLNTIYLREEITWYQRSRTDWIRFGDRNTKFFHSATVSRRRRNRIDALQNDVGDWIADPSLLMSMAVEYYDNLYKEDIPLRPNFPIRNKFPEMERRVMMALESCPSSQEIKGVVFSMGPFKAPGVDGLHSIFFQSQWDVVESSVCNFIKGVFNDPSRIEEVNQTLLCLIPKLENPHTFKDFRPISLCNVIYKTVTKIVANRLKLQMDKLVMPNQCSFIRGRQGTDNVIIAQELIHSMRKKRGSKGWMAIKVDLEKAYDRISWNFLQDTLYDVGLPENLIRLIMLCVSSCTMNVLWNGACTKEFRPTRGLRQGDPLSPYLFVLCMERLAHLISQAVDHMRWKPVRIKRGAPQISHLFFADDLLLFAEASQEQVLIIQQALHIFCDSSGQKVNHSKTRVFFSQNVGHTQAKHLSGLLGFSLTADLGRYLGIPLHHKRVGRSSFFYVLDRMSSRIAAWNHASLSLAGRVTLSKAVLLAIPSYPMQVCSLPQVTCEEIDRKIQNFVWGSSPHSRRSHLVAWKQICMDKKNGGLGLRSMREMNSAFIMKVGFNLVAHPDALWSKFLRAKYNVEAGMTPIIHAPNSSSQLWKGITRHWNIIMDHSRVQLGNGQSTMFWLDSWLPDCGPLISYAGSQFSISDTLQKVVDYVDELGQWKWNSLRQLLPDSVLHRFMNFLPPSSQDGQDHLIWNGTTDGKFTVKSAYAILAIKDTTIQQFPWESVWRWQGPERIRFFLWLMAGEKLMTNVCRLRRHMALSDLCPRCNQSSETIFHTIRDCPQSKEVWCMIMPHINQREFFNLNLHNWIISNLDSSKDWGMGSDWPLLFGILAWKIWKCRNSWVFEGDRQNAYSLIRSAIGFRDSVALAANPVFGAGNQPRNRIERLVAWCCPPVDWVKLNVDGACDANGTRTGCGGVFRDASGTWIVGFCKNLGSGTVLHAELWACLVGLELAWGRGFRQVWLEGDSLSAQQLITNGCHHDYPAANLVNRIRNLMQRDWQIYMSHIHREGNRVADFLASYSYGFSWVIQEFDCPQSGCIDSLYGDTIGVHWSRLCA
ncbi:uncharacterized protein LOC133295304 [Gastrolobium bilobum]|uniref:uncharacterized protein LOC133295304 n=1 Tax=Gastrolobium bilobum TaxID=150636 RepID=UPI002AB0EE3F|nr:uncharacterized protein LOC133295304 [Gastrolobium bilobum]